MSKKQQIVETGEVIAKEISALLQEYAEKKGYRLVMGLNFHYSDTSIRLKPPVFYIPPVEKGIQIPVLTQEEEDYDCNMKIYSLPPRGTSFVFRGQLCVVRGWAARAKKYQILVENTVTKATVRFAAKYIRDNVS